MVRRLFARWFRPAPEEPFWLLSKELHIDWEMTPFWGDWRWSDEWS